MKSFFLSFKSDDVRHIVEAFESRYGRWTKEEEKEFLTQGGGRFPNAHWLWKFPNVSVSITQHIGKLGDGQATVTLGAALEEAQARREQRKRGAGKGL